MKLWVDFQKKMKAIENGDIIYVVLFENLNYFVDLIP